MTEEDQLLVAKAGLAGVRFFRRSSNNYWSFKLPNAPVGKVAKYTLGRAAALALRYMGLMTHDEWQAYEQSTDHIREAVDVDISLLQATALAAEMPDAATATAAPCADPELLPR